MDIVHTHYIPMLPAITEMPKLLVFIAILFLYPCNTYGQNSLITIDSIDKVIVIDHQNFNYEWYCGRTYDIIRVDDKFVMRRVEQYNKPYFFGQPEQTIEKDSLDFSDMQTLKAFNMPVENPDSLIVLANSVASRRHGYWYQHIKIENNNDTVNVNSFDFKKFTQLIDVINDKQSKSLTSIPMSLEIDSSWSTKNAERLFDLYKLKDKEPTDGQRNFCLSCFSDSKKIRTAAIIAVYGRHNTSDYPFIELQFIQQKDTFSLYTDLPTPYSVPWLLSDSIKYFNPEISILISDLLPEAEYSNKKRLAGDYSYSSFYKSLEEAFTERMINRYCTDFNLKKKGKKRQFYVDEEKSGNKR